MHIISSLLKWERLCKILYWSYAQPVRNLAECNSAYVHTVQEVCMSIIIAAAAGIIKILKNYTENIHRIKHILYVGKTLIMKIKSNTTNKDLP